MDKESVRHHPDYVRTRMKLETIPPGHMFCIDFTNFPFTKNHCLTLVLYDLLQEGVIDWVCEVIEYGVVVGVQYIRL